MVDTSRAVDWLKNNREFAVIIAAFVSTQLFLIASIWNKPMFWDSSIYIATGKYIYSLGEYGFWSSYRGPGVPLLIGLFWKLGMPTIGFPRLVWMMVSATGITVFYSLSDRLFGRNEAILTAGILAASHAYYFFTPEILTGIPSSILIFACLYMVTREKYIPAGMLAAAAFIFRYPAALVGPAAVLFIIARGLKQRQGFRQLFIDLSKFSGVVIVVISPYMAFLQLKHGWMFKPFLESASFTASAGTTYNAGLYYLVQGVKTNPLNIFLPVGIYAVVRERNWKYGAFFSGLVLFYGFFSTFPLKIERYILPFLPLMAVLSARGIREAIEFSENKIDHRMFSKSRAVWLTVAAILVVLGASFYTTYNSSNYARPVEQKKYFSAVSGLEGTVATNDPRTNLYADFRYHPLPPGAVLDILDSREDEVDHWVINGCYWDCRGVGECEQRLATFEERLDKKYGKSFEAQRDTCNYAIYSR